MDTCMQNVGILTISVPVQSACPLTTSLNRNLKSLALSVKEQQKQITFKLQETGRWQLNALELTLQQGGKEKMFYLLVIETMNKDEDE